jgi:hypothetical protein
MKIAYLVIAHNNPELLQKLTGSLSSQGSPVFIHIDKRRRIEDFSIVNGPNIFFSTDRYEVYWGEYGMVDATLELIRMAMDWPGHCDYLVLLSGADYPLRSQHYIQSQFAQQRGCEFISTVTIPCVSLGQFLSRVNTVRYPSNQPLLHFASKVLAKCGLARRDYRKSLPGLQAYSGSAWWALTREACQYILEFLQANPHVADFFRVAPAPDEMVFHTILGNSHFAPLLRRNFHFTEWAGGGPHPATLSDKHVSMFESQGRIIINDGYGRGEALFARKFSEDRLDLLERIDVLMERADAD